MKTISLNVNTVDKKWVVVDAADQVLGRIATKVAAIIRGKLNPPLLRMLIAATM